MAEDLSFWIACAAVAFAASVALCGWQAVRWLALRQKRAAPPEDQKADETDTSWRQ